MAAAVYAVSLLGHSLPVPHAVPQLLVRCARAAPCSLHAECHARISRVEPALLPNAHHTPCSPITLAMQAGMEPWDVHMSDLLSGAVSLDAFQGIVFVGGFRWELRSCRPSTCLQVHLDAGGLTCAASWLAALVAAQPGRCCGGGNIAGSAPALSAPAAMRM